MRVAWLLLLLLASPSAAEENTAPPEAPTDAAEEPVPEEPETPLLPKPRIGLDRLLDPRAVPAPPPPDAHPQGKSRKLWREEFVALERDIRALEERIEGAQLRFREVAGHEWGYTPPGAGAPPDPEVLKIRAQLKRDRQSLETARRRKRDLEIEASLEGVPRDWLDED